MTDEAISRQRLAYECVTAGIEAAHPETVVRTTVTVGGDVLRIGDATFDLADYGSVVILGGGNAASQVAAALETELEGQLSGGMVVTDDPAETERIEVLPGDHPVPSERGTGSTRRLLKVADDLGENTLVLAVITGGASALLAAPAEGISLADLRETTNALLASGATIYEMNSVRKHLSELKGGHLARRLSPARVATLLFSDVIGNDRSVIGSGPTVPDPSTYADALNVLENYDVTVPNAVYEHLKRGSVGSRYETPAIGDSVFESVSTHVLADNRTAIEGAVDVVEETNYEPMILSTRIRGEAREAAKTHAAVAEEVLANGDPLELPCVILSGGECTVTVRGDGKGGPNLEFALSGALELPSGATLCTVDTDGIDGSTDAAGAIVSSETVANQHEARSALRANDALPYLAEQGALVETGPTGTNVNDLRALVVDHPEDTPSC